MQCTLGPAHLDVPTVCLKSAFVSYSATAIYLAYIYTYIYIYIYIHTKSSGKTKNKMGGRRPEGHYEDGEDEKKAEKNGGVL